MIFETHCHLDDKRFDLDRAETIARMREQGITALLNVGYDLESSIRSISLAQSYPEIYAAVGIHPHDVKGMTEQDWVKLEELAQASRVIALGEIGLDYYRDLSPRPLQQEAFVRQLKLANHLGLPVIIHNRDAHQDVINILKADAPRRGGILHCFSGSWETAKLALDLGLYISFAGPVTYKNAVNLQEVAAKVPLDRILIETDAPYLTPEPLRGKRNEPGYVRLIAEKIAQIRGMDTEEFCHTAATNGERLFGLKITT